MPIHVSKEDAARLIKNLETSGGDVTEIKKALELSSRKSSGSIPQGDLSDEEYVKQLIKQSPKQIGENLRCLLCNNPAKKLISGTCLACFTKWALSTRKKR